MLERGDHVQSGHGGRLRIRELIGEGTQGTVYKASGDRGPVAVKWYHPEFATTDQRRLLDVLVGRPSPDRRFLWPIDVVTAHGDDGFGYSMALRPEHFVSLSAWMSRTVDLDLARIATIGINLADAFLHLHAIGLCYRDLNFENVFFDPSTGDTLICDTDNIGVEGLTSASVRGTTYCMAPELVRRECEPSTATDRHSLAVMLFFLLMLHDPLDGAATDGAWDADAVLRAYGTNPTFVFDPHDDSNRPVEGLHDHVESLWWMMSDRLRELFERAFTVGLGDALYGRVLETEWRAALSAMRDLIVPCTACGRRNILREDTRPVTCWSCRAIVAEPLRLRIGRLTLAAAAGAALFPHHLRGDYDFSRPVAHVGTHPDLADVVGLKNESSLPWWVRLPSGKAVDVAPDVTIRLVPDAVITAQVPGSPSVDIHVVAAGQPPASMSA